MQPVEGFHLQSPLLSIEKLEDSSSVFGTQVKELVQKPLDDSVSDVAVSLLVFSLNEFHAGLS